MFIHPTNRHIGPTYAPGWGYRQEDCGHHSALQSLLRQGEEAELIKGGDNRITYPQCRMPHCEEAHFIPGKAGSQMVSEPLVRGPRVRKWYSHDSHPGPPHSRALTQSE